MKIDPRKLQHTFGKHAADFGIAGTWNLANAALFEKALQDHVASPTVQQISGTFRGTIAVTHYFDSGTDLNVMVDANDEFVGGWKLSLAQKQYLLASGNVQ
jgi:hypothetical protein